MAARLYRVPLHKLIPRVSNNCSDGLVYLKFEPRFVFFCQAMVVRFDLTITTYIDKTSTLES